MIYVPFLFYCPPVHIQMLKWHIQYWKPNVKMAYSLNSIARHVYAYLSCIMKAKLFIHCLCCVFCIEMLRNSLIPFTFRNRLHFSSAQLIWISIGFIKYFFDFFSNILISNTYSSIVWKKNWSENGIFSLFKGYHGKNVFISILNVIITQP